MEKARSLLLLVLCVPGLVWAREVHVHPGPLYRVLGNAVSLRCSVSDYEGPPTQNFEWFMYRPAAPDISIAIASTKERDFSYAVYAPRVQRGEIAIHRLNHHSVELQIQSLRAEDEGVYECYTPTTDAQYRGSYSAKVALKVIADTLQVSARSAGGKGRASTASPLQLNLVEGRELHLTCVAAAHSTQHTHLSVTFALSTPGAPVGRETLQDIISVQRDFSIEPANQTFSDRIHNGEIRLEKGDNSTYKLVIARLRPQDTATYHCTTTQWIQDPDRSWQPVTQRRAVLAQLSVQTLDSHMKVLVSPREVNVEAGGTAELFCNVSLPVSLPPDVVLSVDWWVTSAQESPGQRVASLGTDGVVSLGERYEGAEVGTRHISLEKLGPGSFRLRIYSAQPGDVGAYSCDVTASISYPGPRLEEVSHRVSARANLLMSVQEISLSAQTLLDSAMLYRGDTAVLLCNVTVETPQTVHVAVSWWVELAGEKPNERTGRLLVSVNRHGVLEAGSRYSSQELSTDKVGAESYRLRLFNIRAEDEGLYHCAVSAWVQYPDHTWYNAASAKSNAIKIYPYTHARDMLLIPMVAGVASALFVGVTVLASVTCCYMRRLRVRKR